MTDEPDLKSSDLEKKIDTLYRKAVTGPVKDALREAVKIGFVMGLKQTESRKEDKA